jgi:Fe-S cluster biogenesis protein NfuA/nitrite reductase/ring-hydroxylating ferredoxin subunit
MTVVAAERMEALLEEVEGLADPAARDTALELVQGLLDLYGEGLARVVGHVAARDEDGALAEAFAGDELVSHLLLLHGLHPVPLEARVRGALDEVRPYLESHGGDVELLGIEEGVVRLAMRGSCDGCASSAATLKLAIEDAIQRSAPDVDAVVADGAAPEPAPALLQLEVSDALRPSAWTEVGELDGAPALVREVAGAPVLFVALDGGRYAYRAACPGCGAALDGASLDDGDLRCAGCGERYDARHAGRSRQTPGRHLDPVPLLVGADGAVRVAAGAGA